MQNKKGLYLVLIFVLLFVFWIVYTFYKAYQPKAIVIQGEIDAQSYNISSKIPGRISNVFVKKGDMVDIGDSIFTIESPEVQAKLTQAHAAKDAASAQSKQADNGARKQEIQAAHDQWKKADAAKKLMQATYNRIQNLYKEGIVSEQKRDEVYTQYKAAKYTANAAHQMSLMAQEGARKEVKDIASAQQRVYEGKVDEVNAYVKETHQYAFHKAQVTQILLHAGELSPTGFPVVSTVDIEDSWAKFSVREDYLRNFEEGKIFKVKIPALSDSLYEFKVSNISVMGEYASWRATESGKGFDMKSFEVELRAVQPIKNLRVGMSVLLPL